MTERPHIGVIGGGFCGLSAAYELAKRGMRVTLFERDTQLGGLAGSFEVGGVRLEKFYHHWFTNDEHVMGLINELGVADKVVHRPTRTGMYYANRHYRLSSPLDLLRFDALSLIERIRLGILTLRARRVTDWRYLESLTAAQWLRQMGGDRVYDVVWEPLLRGKFGDEADAVSAVWFWNKLKLRGGSRGRRGEERLAYFQGGFAALAERLADAAVELGATLRTECPVTGVDVVGQRVMAVRCGGESVPVDMLLATPALPIIAGLIEPHVDDAYLQKLRRVRYLANICLVLELNRSLSKSYWLNVNDPDFPFVGVIEHTNFEPCDTYGGRHIAYLSKYLPETAELYMMSDDKLFEFTLPYLQRMFPSLERSWIDDFHVWRAAYSQPVIECRYSELIPPAQTPLSNMLISTMAQIYPEDRGTNYAIREGRAVARQIARRFSESAI